MFKTHSREGLSFNGNVKIINATLKFLMNMPTQKAKLNFAKDKSRQSRIPVRSQSRRLFKKTLWFWFKIYFLKTFFTIFLFFYLQNISFYAFILFYTQSAFKETQSVTKHSRHSEGTWEFRQWGLSATWSTWVPRTLGHSST